MSCLEIREKLLYYIDNKLDDNENKNIKQHIECCADCRKEYEEMLGVLKFAEEGFDKVKAPDNFMENIRDEVKRKLTPKPGRIKHIRTAFIAAALCVVFTVTALAASGFDFMKWWQEISLKESQSIEKLISNGYGENVNISAVDKDIRITIENVVADDTGTILSYSIEDLSKINKYMMNYMDGMQISGDFIFPSKKVTNPFKGQSVLYSESPYIQEGMFRLDPIRADSGLINININKLDYGNEKPFSSVEGSWKFSIPVTRHEAKIYTLNEEADVDGNKVLLKELKISPTNTSLTYSYKVAQGANYSISGFFDIKLISNGKEYNYKSMGTTSYKSRREEDEQTIEFDSMYFDSPDKIKIVIGYYIADVNKYAYYDIDVNKPFPQIFEYFGSKISIDKVNIGDEKTEITMSQSFEENRYERLNVKFMVKGHPFGGRPIYEGNYESYTLNKRGRRVEPGNSKGYIEEVQPKTYITKQQLILEDPPGTEKLPQEYHTGKLIPVQLTVNGYQETRYVNKSFTIKLNK